MFRWSLGEKLQVLSRSEFQSYWLRRDLSQSRLAGRGFFFPLGRTAEDASVFYGHFTFCQQSVDGIARVLSVHHFLAIAVVHVAFVPQFSVFVEDEDVRRGLRAVRAGNRLSLTVVEIRVVEMFVFESNFHLVEAVADVGRIQFIDAKSLGVVWLDGHDGDAAVPIVGLQLLNALLVHLRNRTVIAGENDDQNRRGRVVGKRVSLSIYTGQRKIRSRRAQRENGMAGRRR